MGQETKVDYFYPENIRKFADFLFQERDYLRAASEYQRYFFITPQNKDFALYKVGLSYRKGQNYNNSIRYFSKIIEDYPQSKLSSSAHYQIGLSYLENEKYQDSLSFLQDAVVKEENKEEKDKLKLLLGLDYLNLKKWDPALNVFDSIQVDNHDEIFIDYVRRYHDYANKGKKLRYKSKFLSGLFSTIIPGSGKIYCNRTADGITSFMINSLLGILTYTSFNTEGPDSTRGRIYGTFFTLFYSGNIYGSVVAAENYNRELEDSFIVRMRDELPYPENY